MTDDLQDRLTTAIMEAMGCQRWYSRSECELHGPRVVEPSGWPCPTATLAAERLLPFVRAEIADALEQITRRWQLKDWADAPRDADPVRERLANAQYVTKWLRTRAEDVRRG